VLAAITARGREVVEQATQELMAMDFGLEGYTEAQCHEVFDLLRPLRVDAGDFTLPPKG
jgi:hypothetical protein